MNSGAYPKILHIGDKAIADLYNGDVEITEKVDGCVTPETPILMANLSYIPASKLSTGDTLVGFNESMNRSFFTEAVVTHTGRAKKECMKITFEDGRYINVTTDHPLVIRCPRKTSDGLTKRYVVADKLVPGMRVVDLGFWEKEKNYEAGYIAGQFDGEGSLVGRDKARWGALTYYQATNKGAELIKRLLENRGFSIGHSTRQRNENWSTIDCLRVNGGLAEKLRFLGTFRPQRLLNGYAEKILWNAPFNAIKDTGISNIEYIGEQTIITLSTSTKTYIANGFCSHNSQFGFGKLNGELVCRSKGKIQDNDDPDKMFIEAVEYVKSIQDRLPEGMFFYGEYLQKPRHSTLAYDRIPKNHIALFGVMKPDRSLAPYDEIVAAAKALDIDVVPLIYSGASDAEHTLSFMETTSFLGGQKIEGVVVKRYEDWLFLGRLLTPVKAGKFVTEAFKEVHQKDWSRLNTGKGKFEVLKDKYHSEARWNKAIMHLKEKGEFDGSVRDIGNLMKEIHHDLTIEEKENIKDELWNIYKDDILRYSTYGFVEWYKTRIAKGDFQDGL